MDRRTAVAYRPPTALTVDDTPSADALVAKVRLRIARDLATGKVEIPAFPKVALELHTIYLEPDVVQVVSDALHAQVGAVVLSSWGMHTIAKRIAERHHEPLKVTGPDAPIVRAVAIADAADKLVALDLTERTLRLSVDPVVLAGKLSSELVEQLAAGVDTIRADEMLNAMTA